VSLAVYAAVILLLRTADGWERDRAAGFLRGVKARLGRA